MSLSPLTFTGVSTFSQDFQTVLDRAAKIASLPLTALQNQQKDIVQQKLLLSNLSTSAGALASTVSKLGDTGANKALSASSSNTSKVTATNISSPSSALYTITEITSVAKAAAETSAGFADSTLSPASVSGTVKLIAGSQEFSIDLTSNNNLVALRDAINSKHAGVTASILTTGTGPTPYYLSVTADTTGATDLRLIEDPDSITPTDLLSSNNQGADTVFKLNGVDIRKSSSLINDVVPGVVFNIYATTSESESVTVNVTSDRSKLYSALQEFTGAYNSTRDQVDGQVGSSAGLLTGEFVVREVQSRLRGLTSYYSPSSGSIKSLTDLGIEFDSKGVATLNKTTFDNLSSSQLNDAFTFLGSTSSGFGGLSAGLTSISDPALGLAKIQLDKYDESDRRIAAQVTAVTARITDMQRILSARLQTYDALLAGLQSQQNTVEATIKGLNATLYGTNNQ